MSTSGLPVWELVGQQAGERFLCLWAPRATCEDHIQQLRIDKPTRCSRPSLKSRYAMWALHFLVLVHYVPIVASFSTGVSSRNLTASSSKVQPQSSNWWIQQIFKGTFSYFWSKGLHSFLIASVFTRADVYGRSSPFRETEPRRSVWNLQVAADVCNRSMLCKRFSTRSICLIAEEKRSVELKLLISTLIQS